MQRAAPESTVWIKKKSSGLQNVRQHGSGVIDLPYLGAMVPIP